jgi:hypothetical protein
MQNSAGQIILHIDVSEARSAVHNRLFEDNGFEIIDLSDAGELYG